jgi:hypothetical protein
MNVRSLIVGAVIAMAPIAVHAQVGLYMNPIAEHVEGTKDSGYYAFLGQNSTSRWFYGFDVGGYYEHKTAFPFKAGVDIHDSVLHGNGAMLNNFNVGLRLSFRQRFRPFVEPWVGAGTTRAPFTDVRVTKVAYGVSGGLEYATHHHIDFRLIEVNAGALTSVSSETSGGQQTPPPRSTGWSFTSGIVFRFP